MFRLPAPFDAIPRTRLLFSHPSPIEPLSNLTDALASDATFYIKREDANSGLAFGGNKVRKLEYVLAHAVASGADTLVTTGGVQSNHMRQTAAAAARLGLQVALYPLRAVKDVQPEYNYAGNVQLNRLLRAETFPVDTSEEDTLSILRTRGRMPYSIPPGTSAHPLGGLGFARCAFEILEQERELGVSFAAIVVAAGGGSTIAGLVAGFKLAQKEGLLSQPKKIIGYNIMGSHRGDLGDRVLAIAQTAAEKIGLSCTDITRDDYEVDDAFLGPGYGMLDERTEAAIKDMARLEGVLLDPVYTGKAAAGMLHRARGGGLAGNVLFMHTGGQPAMSAYPQLK